MDNHTSVKLLLICLVSCFTGARELEGQDPEAAHEPVRTQLPDDGSDGAGAGADGPNGRERRAQAKHRTLDGAAGGAPVPSTAQYEGEETCFLEERLLEEVEREERLLEERCLRSDCLRSVHLENFSVTGFGFRDPLFEKGERSL